MQENPAQPEKKENSAVCKHYFHEVAKIVQFMESRSRISVARGRGEGKWGATNRWAYISVEQDESVQNK